MTDDHGQPAHTGGCHCGAIRYRSAKPYMHAVHCHCGTCRRSSGAAFMTWVLMPREAFAVTKGRPIIRRVSDKARRAFCGSCGAQIYMDYEDEPSIDVSIGTLDAPDEIVVLDNIWAAERIVAAKGFDAALPDHEGDPERPD